MRLFKIGSILVILVCIIFGVFYMVKQPAYTLKTSGTLYVVNKASQSITIFDLFEGRQIKELALPEEPHEATTLTNPGRVVVTNYGSAAAKGKSITVINAATNTIENTIALDESQMPHGIIALPESNEVAVVTDIGNDLSIVNIDTGKLESQIPTQQDFSHLLVKHPGKPLIYVSNINSGSVSVIDIQLNKVLAIILCSNKAEGIAITPDGTELWVTNIQENFISVINTENYEVTNQIETGKEPLRLKFSNDGTHCLVSNSSDGTVSVFNTKTKELIKNIIIPGKKNFLDKLLYRTPRPVGILMHPNGLYAFVSNITAGRVEVIDLRNFNIVSSIKVGEMPDGLTLINSK